LVRSRKANVQEFDSDSDTEAGHTRSGRVFREVHLANLFKKNYGEEGFYSGEEAELTDEEHSEPARAEEGKAEELHWENLKPQKLRRPSK
jgi:hypothetical protein